jgi:positive regulator of sigma E activity
MAILAADKDLRLTINLIIAAVIGRHCSRFVRAKERADHEPLAWTSLAFWAKIVRIFQRAGVGVVQGDADASTSRAVDTESVTEAKLTGRRSWMGVSAPSVPAGIYGTVICASILASAGDTSAGKVAVAVVVTLFVYWLAERYSEILGLVGSADHHEPQKITGDHVRTVLKSGWPMIQASVTPLLVLLVSRLAGASSAIAVDIALAYTIVLLTALGWLAATRAGLVGWPRLTAAGFATVLGLVVVILKASLH